MASLTIKFNVCGECASKHPDETMEVVFANAKRMVLECESRPEFKPGKQYVVVVHLEER